MLRSNVASPASKTMAEIVLNAVIRGRAVPGDNLVPLLVVSLILPACLLPPRISLDVRSTNAFFPTDLAA